MAAELSPLDIADVGAQPLTLTNFLCDAVEPRVTTAQLRHAVPLTQHSIPMIAQALSGPGVPAPIYLFFSIGAAPSTSPSSPRDTPCGKSPPAAPPD